jgi:hypothetical protein
VSQSDSSSSLRSKVCAQRTKAADQSNEQDESEQQSGEQQPPTYKKCKSCEDNETWESFGLNPLKSLWPIDVCYCALCDTPLGVSQSGAELFRCVCVDRSVFSYDHTPTEVSRQDGQGPEDLRRNHEPTKRLMG